MRKDALFDSHWGRGWPELKAVERYFVGQQKDPWLSETENDSAGLTVEGVEGTEHLEEGKGRIDIHLTMWGKSLHGVLLIYEKRGGGYKDTYYSKADLTGPRQFVRSLHGQPLPVGLFIPYKKAWPAVREFMETDGALSNKIEWIADRDLPPNMFPTRFELRS